MSLLLILFTLAPLLVLIALGWLVSRPLPEELSLKFEEKIEDLLPLHSQHLPQLRQSLASADSRYIRRKASKEMERMWREERLQILRGFLTGLGEDFARVDRLARLVASLSPVFSKREELERIWLSLRFRLNYRIVSARIAAGSLGSLRRLRHLTEMVGSLSAQAEAAMARLETAPAVPRGPGPRFNA